MDTTLRTGAGSGEGLKPHEGNQVSKKALILTHQVLHLDQGLSEGSTPLERERMCARKSGNQNCTL